MKWISSYDGEQEKGIGVAQEMVIVYAKERVNAAA